MLDLLSGGNKERVFGGRAGVFPDGFDRYTPLSAM
jgi:hypothetical protein